MAVASDGSRNEQGAKPVSGASKSHDSLGDLDEKQEVDLSSLLDVQVARVDGEGKTANRIILKVCGAVVLLMLIGYVVSASMRREVSGLIQNVKESRDDFDAEAKDKEMSDALNNVMNKLGSRSVDIDNATRSLGVDPTTVKEDGMDAEMKQMMGGEGRTAGERYRLAENLSHLTGTELPKSRVEEEKPTVKEEADKEQAPVQEEQAAQPEAENKGLIRRRLD